MSKQLRTLHGALIDIVSMMNRPQRDEMMVRKAGISLDRALFPLLVMIERLGPIPLGERGQRLARDQRLEVVVMLVLGERRLILEDLVEEELLRLGQRLVDLESLHPGFALGLRQEALQDLDHGIDLAGLGFPEGRDDETIVDRMKIGHVSLLGEMTGET